MSPMLFALIAGMGLAFAGLLAGVVGERRRGTAPALVGAAWYVVVFLPLAWAFLDPTSTLLGVEGSLDYAGAAPLHLGLGTGAAVFTFAFRPGAPRPAVHWAAIRPTSYVVTLAITVVGWGAWLMSTEQDLNRFSAVIFVNTVSMAATSTIASVLTQLLRSRRIVVRTTCGSLVSGLAGATACSAYLEAPAALVLGALVGLVTTQLLHKRRNDAGATLGQLVAVSSIVGASMGLLALGLLDLNRGFFFTGQPTLSLAQAMLIGVSVAYAAVASAVIAFIAVKLPKGAEWWAIPDSNR